MHLHDLPQRMVDKIEPEPNTGCWLWMGSQCRGGYGKVWCVPEVGELAHRVSYVLLKGPISDELEIDHLCRVRQCANPDHMEPVTRQENIRRARNYNRDKTQCLRGHVFSLENTYHVRGERVCRVCANERTKLCKLRKQENDLGTL